MQLMCKVIVHSPQYCQDQCNHDEEMPHGPARSKNSGNVLSTSLVIPSGWRYRLSSRKIIEHALQQLRWLDKLSEAICAVHQAVSKSPQSHTTPRAITRGRIIRERIIVHHAPRMALLQDLDLVAKAI